MAHARATPEQPALAFATAAGPWRWASWAWLAWRVGDRAAELAASRTGARLAYPWTPSPGGVVTDLAIQAAGCLAVPMADGEDTPAAARRVEGWDDRPVRARWGELPVRPPRGAGDTLAALAVPGGGAVVCADGVPAAWSETDLAAAAAALGARLAGAGARRPVVLVGGGLATAVERTWLGWALAAGGVVALPGSPELFAWALAWARPTHVCVAAERLEPLREELAGLDGERGLRRRLRRLAHLLVWGSEVTAAERSAWEALGVSPRPWPQLSASGTP